MSHSRCYMTDNILKLLLLIAVLLIAVLFVIKPLLK